MSDLGKLSLFKRSNGYYYILFEEQGQRRWKSTGCSLKAGALKTLTQFQQPSEKKPEILSLSQFSREFLVYARVNYAKATVDIFTIASNHLMTISGGCSLPLLNARHVDLYKTKRLKDSVSPVTINVELRALRAMLNVAVRWQCIEANPFSQMKQLAIPERRPAFLTRQECQTLLLIVQEKWLKELIIFAVLTGTRRGEMLNLRWQSVDLTRKVIHIETSGTFKTKAGKSRVVPMNETVFEMLSRKAIGKNDSVFVFTKKGRQINGNHVTQEFKEYSRKINEALHWHSLRHTFASWLVQDGVSLYEVQKLLGHSSSEVTQIYSHLAPEQLHNTVNRIVLNS